MLACVIIRNEYQLNNIKKKIKKNPEDCKKATCRKSFEVLLTLKIIPTNPLRLKLLFVIIISNLND